MSRVQLRSQAASFGIVEAEASKEMDLIGALLLYSSSDGRSVYASNHQVIYAEDAPNVPLLGPGSAPSKKVLAQLGEKISAAAAFAGFIPENLLYMAPRLIAWWCPPQPRHLWFTTQDDVIGEASATITQPGVVFLVSSGRLYVFSTEGEERPQPETPLYKAPYFNVWESGEVCTGNVAMPKSMDAGAMKDYERAFYGSRFTHPNDPNLVSCQGGAIPMWKHLLDNPNAAWEWAQWLVPCKSTLAQKIKELTK